MTEFLGFRKMMTPIIIQIIFWIGVGISVLSGIGLMIAGAAASVASNQFGGGAGAGLPGGLLVFAGLIQIIVGPVFVRIGCELTILFFRIYETLTEIRDDGRGKVPQPSPAYSTVGVAYPHP